MTKEKLKSIVELATTEACYNFIKNQAPDIIADFIYDYVTYDDIENSFEEIYRMLRACDVNVTIREGRK